MTERLEYFSLFNSHKRNKRKKLDLKRCITQKYSQKAAHWQKNVEDYQIFGNACAEAYRKLQSEKFQFSQKLYTSSSEAALEHRMSISIIASDSRQTTRVHCSCMAFMTRKRGNLLWNILIIELTTITYLLPVKMLQEFKNISRIFYACAASVTHIGATPLSTTGYKQDLCFIKPKTLYGK